jgi:MYXO-CTERM domain-containing protein
VDNNCNGLVDEDCSTCVDYDQDGSCFGVDCNDLDSRIYPGNVEVCGDSVDNNCDGFVDENCGGASNRGGCNAASSAGSTPGTPALLVIFGLLGLVAFRRRRPRQ